MHPATGQFRTRICTEQAILWKVGRLFFSILLLVFCAHRRAKS